MPGPELTPPGEFIIAWSRHRQPGGGDRDARVHQLSGRQLTVLDSVVQSVGGGLADTDWLEAIADSCLLAGVEAFGAVMRRVVFRRCEFDSVNLRGATLREVLFEDCVLRDADLGGAALTDTAFPGTSLERVRLGRAVLERTDLRGATALDLVDGYDSLRGAVINTHQLLELAPGFADALGLTVRDD